MMRRWIARTAGPVILARTISMKSKAFALITPACRTRATRTLLAGMVSAGILAAPDARAGNLINDWKTITAPAAPQPRHVTLDPNTTALLLLDFVSQTCSAATRPGCIASIPRVARLLAASRAHHATIIYSYVLSGTAEDINPALKRGPGEAAVQSGPDKFLHTDLARLLRQDHIKTVIVTGTAAEGAVLATAAEAAYRGFRVVLPYDGMSSAHPYAEQYVAWDLLHAPVVSLRTTLTSTRDIDFH